MRATPSSFCTAGPYPKLRPMQPKPRADTSSPLFPSLRLLCALGLGVLLLALSQCRGSQHSSDEKYYLIATNVKLPYWQQVAAGLTRAAAQLGGERRGYRTRHIR